jgi:hypothetical protein
MLLLPLSRLLPLLSYSALPGNMWAMHSSHS